MSNERMKAVMDWVDQRLPVSAFVRDHLTQYYAPKNFNVLYFFGSLALFVLINQIVTGIFLAMHYKPDAGLAFDSIEYIMRDVKWGWLLRYMHSTGASAFFIVIYLHMFRALFYGSFKKPRELLWLFGMVIFLLLMAEAFMGYLLPWGQMSYWGAQVIISLFGAIPVIGEDLATWVRGDYVVADATLTRFFALHVVAIPLAIVMLVVLHLAALHTSGSGNPDGIEIKEKKDANGIPLDGIPLHPYYTVKDLYAMAVFVVLFALVVFYAPEMGGYFLEHPNFEPADPMKTPEHIAPVWYFTPFYSILRSVPDKLGGVIAMGASIVLLFGLPWLDRCQVRSIRYRGAYYKTALTLFVLSFLGLGILGTKPVTPTTTFLARFFSLNYFAFFLLMPWYSLKDRVRPLPERLTEAVIPLEKREGIVWEWVRRGIAAAENSKWYQRAGTQVAACLEKAREFSGIKK
ncbi:cytochrome b [Methylococcus geothermalis]|uniref:Cytochrome b n=1 Tax=Methylococcus geothermalis TaxID=2681310 RepID=A0A858Q7P5_9GAMM|nr:cytochrome bc complex cytochrome b subunit [Methylococcus geothermalis]QJD29804.1 cytochrome b [Methylococcus geothermalis]